jgi:2'-hydroxyisoflavone reductase
MGVCLSRVNMAVGGGATLTWVSEEFLKAHDVQPWLQVPLWLHAAEQSLDTVSIARAIAAGLTFRALEDTARETLAWERALVTDARPASPTLTAEREGEVLAAWHAAGH